MNLRGAATESLPLVPLPWPGMDDRADWAYATLYWAASRRIAHASWNLVCTPYSCLSAAM
jgi:hypothetical protein